MLQLGRPPGSRPASGPRAGPCWAGDASSRWSRSAAGVSLHPPGRPRAGARDPAAAPGPPRAAPPPPGLTPTPAPREAGAAQLRGGSLWTVDGSPPSSRSGRAGPDFPSGLCPRRGACSRCGSRDPRRPGKAERGQEHDGAGAQTRGGSGNGRPVASRLPRWPFISLSRLIPWGLGRTADAPVSPGSAQGDRTGCWRLKGGSRARQRPDPQSYHSGSVFLVNVQSFCRSPKNPHPEGL